MVIIQVCVGSSCYLKGSSDLVEMLKKSIAENHLEDSVTLTGSFCAGKCNRTGVTITVNDNVYTGITRENYHEFWQDKVMPALRADA